MIRLELRCVPRSGRADLAWLADLTGSLDEICDFLLRAELATQIGSERVLGPEELARAVDGHAVEQGSPIVHLRDGSTIIELAAQLVDSTIPVQVLASVALLFKRGPEVAAWPGHIKKGLVRVQGRGRAGAARIPADHSRVHGRGRRRRRGPESATARRRGTHPRRESAPQGREERSADQRTEISSAG